MLNSILLSLILAFIKIECSSTPKVIIIGSGPAGIAATATLLENNISDITILEAEARIGGRINSIHFGEAIVDLGAQWCHGRNNNVVFELANKHNLLEADDFSSTFYYSSREHIDPVLAKEIEEIINGYNESEDAGNISLGEYLFSRYNEHISNKYSDNKTIKFAADMLQFFAKSILVTEGSLSIFDVAADMDYVGCEGPNYAWKGYGYKTILDILLRKFPDPNQSLPFENKLQLNKTVTRVLWDDSSEKNPYKVAVECADNSVYLADYVIFTPSLGVLKDRHDSLFQPKLPEDKITAIRDLGMGAVAKLLLYFPNKWWFGEMADFSFVWDEQDSKNVFKEFPYGLNKDSSNQHWLMALNGFSSVNANPKVLMAWFSGKMVPYIESLSDKILVDGAMFALNKFVGHLFNITAPADFLRTKWYSNPNFLGTYSYQTVESQKGNISAETILSQPLYSSDGEPRLFFAGEATHPIHYSTVHGAIESGQREAHRIIKLHAKHLQEMIST